MCECACHCLAAPCSHAQKHYLRDFVNTSFLVLPDVRELMLELLGPVPRTDLSIDGFSAPLSGLTIRVRDSRLQYTSKHNLDPNPVTPEEGLATPLLRLSSLRSPAVSCVLPAEQLLCQTSPLRGSLAMLEANPDSSPTKELWLGVETEGLPLPVQGRSLASKLLLSSYRDWVSQYARAMRVRTTLVHSPYTHNITRTKRFYFFHHSFGFHHRSECTLSWCLRPFYLLDRRWGILFVGLQISYTRIVAF